MANLTDNEMIEIFERKLREELVQRLARLAAESGKCERCPEGPCAYCEYRGVVALLARLDGLAPQLNPPTS